MVSEQRLEDRVDSRLGVAAARLERLGHLVKEHATAGPLGRQHSDPAIADERPEFLRRVGEEGRRITHTPSMPANSPPSRAPPARCQRWPAPASAGQRDGAGGTVSRVARYDDDLRFAHVLADAADDITAKRFRALDLKVETKPDLTPVTDADRATEESLRNVLRRARPRDAVLGEEMGRSGSGPRCWVIDPIDGTKNYVRGVPVWATLIGLMDGPEVVAGVVSAPALGRRWWGALGGGAWTGRSLSQASPCRVSGVTKLGDASLSYSGLGGWAERGLSEEFLDLTRSVWRTRAFGDFWSHMLVAEGACDISTEPEVSLWDLAALKIIVTEAGGQFTSLEGVPTPDGGSVVCTNGYLHDEVLGRLGNVGGGLPPDAD